jgi:hypothetical protein
MSDQHILKRIDSEVVETCSIDYDRDGDIVNTNCNFSQSEPFSNT